MTVRVVIAALAGLTFLSGLVWQLLPLAVAGLVGMLVAVVLRSGRNPLAETYRDVRDPLPAKRDK